MDFLTKFNMAFAAKVKLIKINNCDKLSHLELIYFDFLM